MSGTTSHDRTSTYGMERLSLGSPSSSKVELAKENMKNAPSQNIKAKSRYGGIDSRKSDISKGKQPLLPQIGRDGTLKPGKIRMPLREQSRNQKITLTPKPTTAHLEKQQPFSLHRQFGAVTIKRLDKTVHVTYPDAEAFGPVSFSPGQSYVPTPASIVFTLQRCSLENQEFEKLQSLAENLVIFSRHGKGTLPLGTIGDRRYCLRITTLSESSLNSGLSMVSSWMDVCFLSLLSFTSFVGVLKDSPFRHHSVTVLPLGVLLVNDIQLPWVIFMDDDGMLWALRPPEFDPRDKVKKLNYRENFHDSLGNNVSESPFSWKEDCPNNGIPWSKDDSKSSYCLGNITNLQNLLVRSDLPATITRNHTLQDWCTYPIWTHRHVPSARYIFSELQRINFNKCSIETLDSVMDALIDFKGYHEAKDQIFLLGSNNDHDYAIFPKSVSDEALNLVPSRYSSLTNLLYIVTFYTKRSSKSITAYPLGFLLVDKAPVPWVILTDENHDLFAVRPSVTGTEDDIRRDLCGEDEFADEDALVDYRLSLSGFATEPVFDSKGHNIADDPFLISDSASVRVYKLGKIDIIICASEDPSSKFTPRACPEYIRWTSKEK